MTVSKLLSSRTIFLYTYAFYIFSYFFIGKINVFNLPINLNWISSLSLLFLCFIDGFRFHWDKYVKLYLIFLIFYAFSALYTNYFDAFVIKFFRFFIISYITYWSSQKLVFRYNSLWPVLFPFVAIGVIDSIVTVSQAFGSHYFDGLLEFIGSLDEYESEYMDKRGDLMGRAVAGIFSNAVRNGHYLLLMFFISLLLQIRRFNIIKFIPTLILFIGLFFCQQRSAFFISLLLFSFFVYEYTKMRKRKFLFVLLFIIFLFILPSIIDVMNSFETRIFDTTNDRDKLALAALDYFIEYPIIGGYSRFIELNQMASHNFIMSSFLAGGLFGGIVLIYMVFDQIKLSIKCLKKHNNIIILILSCAFWAMVGDSMTHNSGYVEGDVATWLCWGLLYANIKQLV